MKLNTHTDKAATSRRKNSAGGERGAALAMAMIIMVLIGVVAMTVLSVVSKEARISGSDLQRTQTCYVAAAKLENMTSDFSALFSRTTNPSTSQLNTIRDTDPAGLTAEGFSFPTPILSLDTVRLAELRVRAGIPTSSTALPRTTIPSGPFTGLSASVAPYKMSSTAQAGVTNVQCKLERSINNYLIPLFQFGMFSDKDIELHPGPAFTFNGRVHANGNIYVNGNVTFLDKVTTANELVRDVLRNGSVRTGSTVLMTVSGINVNIADGSVNNGPKLPGAASGQRGYHPDSPDGTANTSWESTSVAAPVSGTPNRFGGQLLTRTTGASQLLLPLQLGGNPTREIIKRQLPYDDSVLNESRYHAKASIRILLDDEPGPPTNLPANLPGGIPSTRGKLLSQYVPKPLPNLTVASGGGRSLWRINDSGGYITTTTNKLLQSASGTTQADTVRGIKASQSTSPNGAKIPAGAGINGRILIEIVPASTTANPSPTPIDVTDEILSMGMTEGEPNGIVYLQRPLWASSTPGSRDPDGGNDYLTYFLSNGYMGMSGEIGTPSSNPNSTYGFLSGIPEDGAASRRDDTPGAAGALNSIVPINVYNVREGRIRTSLAANAVYERGITSVVEINMRNLARWADGVYDNNLLTGTNAVSANIGGDDGYIVYISDRRGDKVRAERIGAANVNMTNGLVDNEDIYGPNNTLDPGEDVIDAGADGSGNPKKGRLQKDPTELPDPAQFSNSGANWPERVARANAVAAYSSSYFRRAVRLFNGEDMVFSGGANKLSATRGLTIATENMVYIWGNYNTTGVNCQPSAGSTLNIPTEPCRYFGDQVPASIVSDAFTPLSKTWFDAFSAILPDNLNLRVADLSTTGTPPMIDLMTSVRAGIISGNNLSALSGSPDAENGDESRLSGGIHNFPRFLENWGPDSRRWNYVGALIPLYHSTQALGPYNTGAAIYSPPIRNWAFDDSFRDPSRLPPGTPLFQYIEPTGFKQVVN